MLNFNYVSIMIFEPSTLEILDFLKAGYLPSTAHRCSGPNVENGKMSSVTDFIDNQDLLDSMVENNHSSILHYALMNELVSYLVADLYAATDSTVKFSCFLLRAVGSINIGISMDVNGYYVTYDLFFDFPCTK